jgi:signal transduction histidine kinase
VVEVLAVAFAVFVPPALLPPALSLAPASSSSITRRGRQHRHGENDEGDRSHSASVAESLHTLEQVITNLVSNAARYTLPHGHVQVAASREDSDAILRVRDDQASSSSDCPWATPPRHALNLRRSR